MTASIKSRMRQVKVLEQRASNAYEKWEKINERRNLLLQKTQEMCAHEKTTTKRRDFDNGFSFDVTTCVLCRKMTKSEMVE